MNMPLKQHFPIANFPDDILETIFRLNVHEDTQLYQELLPYKDATDNYIPDTLLNIDGWRHYPSNFLSQARSSSQVCRSWRFIILNSQLLWARALKIQDFPLPDSNDSESKEWWNEVIRRAGTAPLWVDHANVGDITGLIPQIGSMDQARITHYLLPLLSSNIGRMERLELRLSLQHGLEMDPRWGALREIGSATRKVALIMSPFPNLNAPNLDIRVILTSSLSSVQSLEIFAQFHALHFLAALKHLPHLRHLKVDMLGDQHPVFFPLYQVQEIIILERLECLELHNMLSDAIRLLPHVQPAPGCTLLIKGPVVAADPPPGDVELQEFKDTVVTYYQNSLAYSSLNNLPATQLELYATSLRLHFSVKATRTTKLSNGWQKSFPADEFFPLQIIITTDNLYEDVPMWALNSMMDVMCSLRAPVLTSLELKWFFLEPHRAFDIYMPIFSQFLNSLTSLTILIVGVKILRAIVTLAEESTTTGSERAGEILPALQTLYPNFDGLPNCKECVAILHRFFNWRTVVGKAVSHLIIDDSDILDLTVQSFRGGMYPGLLSITFPWDYDHVETET